MEPQVKAHALSPEVAISHYFASVYKWMTVALGITTFVAWQVASSEVLIGYLMTHSGLTILLIIAQFGLVIALAGWARRMSYSTAIITFLAYAALTGLTFSTIFLVYTTASIFKVFLVTTLMYGATSLYGYTTSRDLSGMGSFLFMSLIGIIIGSLLNFWLHSPLVEWMVTYGGIVVFAGLAAYDHQKLKYYALSGGPESLAITGALSLYLDFINLFLMLLRVMGNRR
ncbi:Bax inhibitor-1/YccA family protein [Patescibacteria group bacterium]|nr:Bax inhibitor-1/YccA family protein [Patescibacteria group bacterium]MBU1016253.1 Bax inhibitor-1/YccA family protein [Patescibacteria group bacterium]MBU1685485.1 Bax inhibitor-1/YccA family protein [Patescibacteria group bacterium]MBU1939111.1 Bax inhibitor-1/YccA family protein [Patescibacteria group bacterium]